MIKVGICGFGYWGPTLYRAFALNPGFAVIAVADPRGICREQALRTQPGIRVYPDGDELIDAAD
ncbi:MAG TPA: gfo/Idh/MocA family oxidoreductase, partial [Stellaceae bacterium]|nr:gfo/Idh/MocA family oxidoreductase [Stellaceae bacterium]